MTESADLQHAEAPANWQPAPEDNLVLAVCLTINVPPHVTVERNQTTGELKLDGLLVPDLVSLRDALTEQIAHVTQEQARKAGWAPI